MYNTYELHDDSHRFQPPGSETTKPNQLPEDRITLLFRILASHPAALAEVRAAINQLHQPRV